MMRILTFIFVLMLPACPGFAQILDVRELHPAQIEALDRARTVVLLTGGILEEHGPFLPSSSDGYQSEFVASRLAEAIVARSGWTVLRFPSLPLGTLPASEIGGKFSAGFKWVFVINLHGGPTHDRALDEASRYFSYTFGGRMVHLTGLASIAGAVPRDLFSPAQRAAEGFSFQTARPVVGRTPTLAWSLTRHSSTRGRLKDRHPKGP